MQSKCFSVDFQWKGGGQERTSSNKTMFEGRMLKSGSQGCWTGWPSRFPPPIKHTHTHTLTLSLHRTVRSDCSTEHNLFFTLIVLAATSFLTEHSSAMSYGRNMSPVIHPCPKETYRPVCSNSRAATSETSPTPHQLGLDLQSNLPPNNMGSQAHVISAVVVRSNIVE